MVNCRRMLSWHEDLLIHGAHPSSWKLTGSVPERSCVPFWCPVHSVTYWLWHCNLLCGIFQINIALRGVEGDGIGSEGRMGKGNLLGCGMEKEVSTLITFLLCVRVRWTKNTITHRQGWNLGYLALALFYAPKKSSNWLLESHENPLTFCYFSNIPYCLYPF